MNHCKCNKVGFKSAEKHNDQQKECVEMTKLANFTKSLKTDKRRTEKCVEIIELDCSEI